MKRNELIETLAEKWTNNASQEALIEFFYHAQVQYLETMQNEELLVYADEYNIKVFEIVPE